MKEVNFYAFFYADKESAEAQCSLKDFLLAVTPLLNSFGQLCKVVWEGHSLAPQPNNLRHSYPTQSCLEIPFVFQYLNLEHACRKVGILKSLLEELAHEFYLGFGCEYHLDDCVV